MARSPERDPIPVISFVGHHNAGKTRLLTRLIDELTDRGLRIGAAKHAPQHESGAARDTDSARLQAAGARRTLLWGKNEATLHWRCDTADLDADAFSRLFFDCDLVLLEGHKHGSFPKIEVFRRTAAVSHEPLSGEIDVLAVVTDDPITVPDGIPRFDSSAIEEIADFLETRFLV